MLPGIAAQAALWFLVSFDEVVLSLFLLASAVRNNALCFLVSFDEVVLSLFLTGPRLSTLPVEMFRYVEVRTDPLIAALSVILVVITLAIVLVVDRTVGLART